MTPEERLAAAAWAATQEIAGSSAHRARLDEAVAVMAPAETWNELKAWRERAVPKGLKHVWMGGSEAMSPRTCAVCLQREDNMMQTMQDTPCPGQSVAPWGASADRRGAAAELPATAALASHRRSVMAAEADPFFGCTAGAPDWGEERPLAEQCAILPERQVNAYLPDDYARMDALPERPATGSDVFFTRQIDAHAELRSLRSQNERLRAELRTMRAVINAALGE